VRASKEQERARPQLVLAVEYTEAAFIPGRAGARRPQGRSGGLRPDGGEHEKEHVAFLKQALGSAADPEPPHEFGDRTKNAGAFTAAAVKLEDLGVATYNGQAVNLTPASLKAAAADRVRRGPSRRLDPQHRRRGAATDATDPAIKRPDPRSAVERASAGRRDEHDGLPPRRLDTDGALREAGENAGISRAGFSAARSQARWRRSRSPHRRGRRDQTVAVLNFALVLEYLQSSFYTEASAPRRWREGRRTPRPAGRRRAGARGGLQEAAGPQGGQAAGLQLRGVTGGRTAVPQDRRRVRGPRPWRYKGQAPRLRAKPVLAAAVAIHSVEARHAAWMRFLFGVQPAVNAFDDASPRGRSSAWSPRRTSSPRAPARRCAGTALHRMSRRTLAAVGLGVVRGACGWPRWAAAGRRGRAAARRAALPPPPRRR
jgi:hypothetical protein